MSSATEDDSLGPLQLSTSYAHITNGRDGQLSRLLKLVDATTGAIEKPGNAGMLLVEHRHRLFQKFCNTCRRRRQFSVAAGAFLILMQNASGFEVREALLLALLATQQFTTLHNLTNAATLRLLDKWLLEAEKDRQTSFLKLLFRGLAHLPVTVPLLQVSHWELCSQLDALVTVALLFYIVTVSTFFGSLASGSFSLPLFFCRPPTSTSPLAVLLNTSQRAWHRQLRQLCGTLMCWRILSWSRWMHLSSTNPAWPCSSNMPPG